MRKFFLLVLIFSAFITVGNAQKLGHINLGNLIAEMPEAARADSTLVLYQKQESMKGDSIAVLFQKEYKVFVEAYNAGTLSATQAQKRQEELQKQQQIIQAYANDVQQKVEILRKQLLQPILAKLDDAIRAIGVENAYTAIFDTSEGAMLFALESEDVTPLVKKKLGLQ
jgi:outer membrane protein